MVYTTEIPSGGWKFEISMLVWLCSGEGSFHDLQMTSFCLCPHSGGEGGGNGEREGGRGDGVEEGERGERGGLITHTQT